MRGVVLGLRFATELALLAALVVAGLAVGGAGGFALGVALPVVAVLAWGRYVAPKSDRRLADPRRAGVELVLFGAAVAGLVLTDHTVAAVVLGVTAAITAPATRRYERPPPGAVSSPAA